MKAALNARRSDSFTHCFTSDLINTQTLYFQRGCSIALTGRLSFFNLFKDTAEPTALVYPVSISLSKVTSAGFLLKKILHFPFNAEALPGWVLSSSLLTSDLTVRGLETIL